MELNLLNDNELDNVVGGSTDEDAKVVGSKIYNVVICRKCLSQVRVEEGTSKSCPKCGNTVSG